MHGDDDRVFARMGRCSDPGRSGADAGGKKGQCMRIGRRRKHIIFEIAHHLHAAHAEIGKAFAVRLALRQTEIDAVEQPRNEAWRTAPALKRLLRNSAIDEDQRNAAMPYLGEEIGPDFRFRDKGKVGVPMIEEADQKFRDVKWQILMECACWQTRRDDGRRRRSPRRQKNIEAATGEMFQERQERQTFSDAGSMEPGERSPWSRQAGTAEPLADARWILQPPPATIIGEQRRQRRETSAYRTIKRKDGQLYVHR